MINAIILSTGIVWAQLDPGQIYYADPTNEAFKALGKASYRQLGLDTTVKKLEEKYIPKELKEYGLWPVLIVKVVTEQRISYEWTF